MAGHTLEHRITAKPDPARRSGDYWEVSTGSPLDYPMRPRLIEAVDNGDGTLSILCTAYESAVPINPGDARDPTPDDGVNQRFLASVARQVAVRDPQLDMEAVGLAASDRNAELLLESPFDLSPVATPPRLQSAGTTEARRVRRRDLLRALSGR